MTGPVFIMYELSGVIFDHLHNVPPLHGEPYPHFIKCSVPENVALFLCEHEDQIVDHLTYESGDTALREITANPDLLAEYSPNVRTGLHPHTVLLINILVLNVDGSVCGKLPRIYTRGALPTDEQRLFNNFTELSAFKSFLRKIDCLSENVPETTLCDCMVDFSTIYHTGSEAEFNLLARKLNVNTRKLTTGISHRWAQCVGCEFYSFNTLMCSRCHSARYCSKDCQKKHWKVHKKNCC